MSNVQETKEATNLQNIINPGGNTKGVDSKDGHPG